LAAKGDPVFEFGLRRAQGVDGALSATRAAYIGGCSGTSNVFAGEVLGIPVVGTHAHSWVMAFDNELEAFMAYARIMPNNVVLLVDTYDTLKGVEHAIVTGKWLREQGHDLIGIRLDSGDLAHLSQESRRRLDDAGFHQTAIVASSELDEHIIASLKEQGAAISVWGVGTKLLTAEGDPSLSAVYKLSALRDPDNNSWEYKIKVSEQTAKVTIPGVLQVRRFFNSNRPLADVIYDPEQGLPNVITQVDLLDVSRRQKLSTDLPSSDLLVPIFHHGQTIYQIPALEAVRENARMNLARFPVGVKRFINPQIYSTGLEKNLYELRMKLILDARGMPAS
jgi:nicotinate phosphoribosyltransferase